MPAGEHPQRSRDPPRCRLIKGFDLPLPGFELLAPPFRLSLVLRVQAPTLCIALPNHFSNTLAFQSECLLDCRLLLRKLVLLGKECLIF